MKTQLDQFSDILFILVLYDLFKIIKIVQYVQNTIRCDADFKRKCYVDCFFQKEFCKNIINIH